MFAKALREGPSTLAEESTLVARKSQRETEKSFTRRPKNTQYKRYWRTLYLYSKHCRISSKVASVSRIKRQSLFWCACRDVTCHFLHIKHAILISHGLLLCKGNCIWFRKPSFFDRLGTFLLTFWAFPNPKVKNCFVHLLCYFGTSQALHSGVPVPVCALPWCLRTK